MSKPLAGKRYFHALGNRFGGERGHRTRRGLAAIMSQAGMDGCPLWARNAFVDGFFGVELRRRPAWTEREQPDYTLAA